MCRGAAAFWWARPAAWHPQAIAAHSRGSIGDERSRDSRAPADAFQLRRLRYLAVSEQQQIGSMAIAQSRQNSSALAAPCRICLRFVSVLRVIRYCRLGAVSDCRFMALLISRAFSGAAGFGAPGLLAWGAGLHVALDRARQRSRGPSPAAPPPAGRRITVGSAQGRMPAPPARAKLGAVLPRRRAASFHPDRRSAPGNHHIGSHGPAAARARHRFSCQRARKLPELVV